MIVTANDTKSKNKNQPDQKVATLNFGKPTRKSVAHLFGVHIPEMNPEPVADDNATASVDTDAEFDKAIARAEKIDYRALISAINHARVGIATTPNACSDVELAKWDPDAKAYDRAVTVPFKAKSAVGSWGSEDTPPDRLFTADLRETEARFMKAKKRFELSGYTTDDIGMAILNAESGRCTIDVDSYKADTMGTSGVDREQLLEEATVDILTDLVKTAAKALGRTLTAKVVKREVAYIMEQAHALSQAGGRHYDFKSSPGKKTISKNGIIKNCDIKAGYFNETGHRMSGSISHGPGTVTSKGGYVARIPDGQGGFTESGVVAATTALNDMPVLLVDYLELLAKKKSKKERPTTASAPENTTATNDASGEEKAAAVAQYIEAHPPGDTTTAFGGAQTDPTWEGCADIIINAEHVRASKGEAGYKKVRNAIALGLNDLATLGEGEGRSTRLYSLAARLARFAVGGWLSWDAARVAMEAAAEVSELTEQIDHNIDSGMNAGEADPDMLDDIPNATVAGPGETPYAELPKGYSYANADGSGDIIYSVQDWETNDGADDDADQTVPICSNIKFLSHGYTEGATGIGKDGRNCGKYIEITQLFGQITVEFIPDAVSSNLKDLIPALSGMGVRVATNRFAAKGVHKLFAEVKLPKQVKRVSTSGWHGKTAFVRPDCIIGAVAGAGIVYSGMSVPGSETSGTLAEWQQNVAAYCKGHSRIAMGLGVAFSAPLLKLLGRGGYICHTYGGSTSGKSGALKASQSVSGSGDYRSSWKTTDNGAEGLATSHNDRPMPMDELGTATGETVSGLAYMINEGKGKQRADRTGGHRKQQLFKVAVFSTGEGTMAEKISEKRHGNKKVNAGETVRTLEIPADAGKGLGIFEHIPAEFQGPKELAKHLEWATDRYYGTAEIAFIEYIIANYDASIEFVRAKMESFSAHIAKGIGTNPQVTRAMENFALVYASLRLAAKAGVLDWSDKDCNIVMNCAVAWAKERGHTGAHESVAPVEAFTDFTSAHAARFEDWNNPGHNPTNNRAGFMRRMLGPNPNAKTAGAPPNIVVAYRYYVFPAAFREACQGTSVKLAAQALYDAGLLLKGKSKIDWQVPAKVPAVGTKKFYIVEVPA